MTAGTADLPADTLTALGQLPPTAKQPHPFATGAQLLSSVRYPGYIGNVRSSAGGADAAALGYAGEVARMAAARGWRCRGYM
jgi:hypothetical protein